MKVTLMKPIPGTTDLELRCNPSSANPRGKEKFVEWDIHDKKLISEFRIESKDPKADYPFKDDPPLGLRDKVRLNLKDTDKDSVWGYNIYWRGNGPVIHKFDPKIPIQPRNPTNGLLLNTFAVVLTFLSILLLFKKVKGK